MINHVLKKHCIEGNTQYLWKKIRQWNKSSESMNMDGLIFRRKFPEYRFPESYTELSWDVHAVFHMALKWWMQSIQNFREAGKSTEEPNGKTKASAVQQNYFVGVTEVQVQVLFCGSR